jgi:hypothetical protein
VETEGQVCSLDLTRAVEGELSPTSATVTSLQRQARFKSSLQGLRSEVHSVERAFLLQEWQVNSAMVLPSPGKRKVKSAACSAILYLFLAEVGGDSRPSMQSEPYLGCRR